MMAVKVPQSNIEQAVKAARFYRLMNPFDENQEK
jgi:hypothetical protein